MRYCSISAIVGENQLKPGMVIYMPIEATLCHIIKGQMLLLQRKSKGRFGAGKWNGVGGKLRINETPIECVRREVYEETGLKVKELEAHGILHFFFGNSHIHNWVVYVFSTRVLKDKLKPSEEGVLQWFTYDNIPFDEMWLDDRYWLPLLLERKRFKGNFHFDEKGEELIYFQLIEQ